MATNDGGPAFPFSVPERFTVGHEGMSLRDWFAGQAVAACSGTAPEWQLNNWFGDRGGISREEIVAKQAYAIAGALLAERQRSGDRTAPSHSQPVA